MILFCRIFYKWWNTLKIGKYYYYHNPVGTEIKQWVEDYKLVPFGPQALFPEYLEMGLYRKYVFMNKILKYVTDFFN